MADLAARVLVFPSANEPGLEILQALAKSNKLSLLAGSSFDRSYDPSRVLVERHLECPALGDEDFRERFEELLLANDVDLVFPTVDSVVAELADWDAPAAQPIVGPAASTKLVLSKRRTYDCLRGHVAVPDVYDRDVPEQAYAKPEVGSGSRGGFSITGAEELELARRRGLLLHELLPGPEYTVDCVSGMGGELLFANVRVRGKVARSISVGTAAIHHPQIESDVRAIAEWIPLRGPWFAQFKEAADGTPKLLEVNARVSGSMTLTRLSGVNIPLVSAFLFSGYEVSIPTPLMGVRVNRFLRTVGEVDDFDWAIWDLDDTLVRKDGKPDSEVIGRLFDLNNQGVSQVLLTKNPSAEATLTDLGIPNFFRELRTTDDKPHSVGDLLHAWAIDPSRCVMINDSVTENLVIQRLYPRLRLLMPDALDLLQREKLQ